MTCLKLLKAPRSKGLDPGSVSRIANILVSGGGCGSDGCCGGAGAWVVRVGMCTGAGGVTLTVASG